MSTLHVLYIITKLELGGAQKICLSLMEGLKKTGHQVGLISGNQGVLVTQVNNDESVFLLDSFKREVAFSTILHELKTFFLMIKHIRKLKQKYPQLIVHTHSTKAGILGRWAAFFAGVKKRVHTIHGFGFHDYQSKIQRTMIIALEYLTSLITTHFICVSQKDQQVGVKLFPRFLQKNSLIRAAVAWNTFYIPAKKINSIPHATFTIGTISCFKPQKNLFDLLKAFKFVTQQVHEKNQSITITLQIIGDGVLRPQLEAWIHENNLSHAIDLLGWQEQTAPWLQRWQLFALSSLWEGLPCSIIEARLSKLPVIAYDVGGIAEVIQHTKNGFLVQPGNWNALAHHMLELIYDQPRYFSMSFYDDNLADFNDTIMIQKHINLYQRLVNL